MHIMTRLSILLAALVLSAAACNQTKQPSEKPGIMDTTAPHYTTFTVSSKIIMQPVRFKNQYNMEVAGHLFMPRNLDTTQKHAAIVVGHPMGAVKEQSANVYATQMAERGFVTLSIDLSFWGESEGQPRNLVAPDIYAEDFSAATDYLGTRPFVDRERIGAIGVCGSGSFVISAAKIDPRLKAIATVSMYDMGAANRQALHRSLTAEQRKQIIAEAARQRYAEFSGGEMKYTGGTVHQLDANTDSVQREFFAFYRTPRGEYTPKGGSPELTTHPTLSSNVRFMNFYPFNDIETISPRPLLLITGDRAHSREFSEDAFKRAAEPKELYIVPDAGHVDLYDKTDLIPFDKLVAFFHQYLDAAESSPAEQTHERPVDNNDTITARMKITTGSKVFFATLSDNATARAFRALLPLKVKMTELNGNEKYFDLPESLPTNLFTPGTIHSGDLLLWGDKTLVVFYKTFGSPYRYTRVGKIDGTEGLANALGTGDVEISFELE